MDWKREVLGGEESREIERDQAKWGPDCAERIYRSLVILDS